MVRKIIPFLFASAVIIPFVLMTMRWMTYQKENAVLNELAAITVQYKTQAPAVANGSLKSVSMEEFIDVKGMKKLNEDICGYIEIKGTQVSYPVMHSSEPHKYQQMNFYGEPSIYGSIYLDNASYLSGTNLVLYGHNMKSGKMFGTLKQYLNDNFARDHQEIRYSTEKEIRIYQVCAVFKASADQKELVHNLIPYTKEEWESLSELLKKQEGKTLRDFSWGDQLITLITCEYSNKNGRLVVLGRLTDTIKRREQP